MVTRDEADGGGQQEEEAPQARFSLSWLDHTPLGCSGTWKNPATSCSCSSRASFKRSLSRVNDCPPRGILKRVSVPFQYQIPQSIISRFPGLSEKAKEKVLLGGPTTISVGRLLLVALPLCPRSFVWLWPVLFCFSCSANGGNSS